MKVCPNCGAENSDGAKFCETCGADLSKAQAVGRGQQQASPVQPCQGAGHQQSYSSQQPQQKSGADKILLAVLIGVIGIFFISNFFSASSGSTGSTGESKYEGTWVCASDIAGTGCGVILTIDGTVAELVSFDLKSGETYENLAVTGTLRGDTITWNKEGNKEYSPYTLSLDSDDQLKVTDQDHDIVYIFTRQQS